MASRFHRIFRPHRVAWWTLVAGLTVTAALGWELHREAVELDRQRLARRVSDIQSQLDSRVEKSEMLLNNLRDYLRLSGENRRAILNRWCYDNGLTINCPWVHGIVVATNKHTPEWRSQFPHPPSKWNGSDWGRLNEIMFKQPVDCEIAFTSSITNIKHYLDDYQLRSYSQAGNRFSRTVKNSRLQMSERQNVMLDANKNAIIGTSFYVPIYSPDLAPMVADAARLTNTVDYKALRWLHFKSMIVAPIDYDALAGALRSDAPTDVEIELFSSTNQTAETWLSNSNGTPRATDPKFKPYLNHRQLWLMYGQKHSIYFYTTPLFEAQSPQRLANMAMAAGLGFTLLATALVGVALRARDQQEVLAEQIREARDALAAAQQERNKISRDLHDGTIQSLYAIQLGLGHTVEKLEADPAKAGRGLSAVRRELDTVIAEIRQFITAEAGADRSVDFGAVLHALVERARNGTTAQLDLQCDPGASERLASDQAVQLANITREALSNSLRHGRPQRVEIALRSDGETVVLEISDDGTGFDPKAPGRSGVGLASMTARAKEMGGALDIQSVPGKGTRIAVRVPTAPPELMEAD